MEIKLINAEDKRYISEIPEIKKNGLPQNAILNKVCVGSGATSVVLQSKEKEVLCVPFVSLIINKLDWCKQNNIEAIGIYYNEEDSYSNSIEALEKFTGNIILVTYDSLQKVAETIRPYDWKITIDECHKIIDSGAFRGTAIRTVLDNYKKFKSFCFVTATPVPDEYQLPELKDIQKYQIKWSDKVLQPVTVNYMPLEDKLHETVAVISLSHLLGNSVGNAHIFINSVKGIISIIRHLKKSGENIKANVRIVCADNERNDTLISTKLGSQYKREDNTTTAKKINFYTSTSFEGSDLLDKEGVCYIVTDGTIDHTKINILSTLPQIAGRIRDSVFKNEVTLIYTPNNYYSHTTEAEFSQYVKEQLKQASESIKDYSTVTKSTQKLILEGSINCPYLINDNGALVLNDLSWYNEMYSFRTVHQTYYVIKDATQSTFKPQQVRHNTIEYNYIPKSNPQIAGLNKLRLGKVPNFSTVLQEYIKLRKNAFSIGTEKVEFEYPIMREAFDVLGEDKLKALEYREGEIQKELIKVNQIMSEESKILNLLNYRIGQWLTKSDIKADLEKVYQELNIIKIANSTDISTYYKVIEHKKTIQGKRVNGFKIINNKIK